MRRSGFPGKTVGSKVERVEVKRDGIALGSMNGFEARSSPELLSWTVWRYTRRCVSHFYTSTSTSLNLSLIVFNVIRARTFQPMAQLERETSVNIDMRYAS